VQFDYNHLEQSGAKLIGSSTLSNVAIVGGAGTWRGEAISILMNPTNYDTDTFNLALNWVGDKGHLSGSYYGSLFRDGYDRMSWENPIVNAAGNTAPFGVYQTTTMSTAPDNQLHQLNLSGGYAFSSTTKLSGGLSYGRNTQDDSFLTGMPEIVLAPRSSLDGRVITTHADMKLTNQTTKDLTLSAAIKYNERDNQSPSAIYQYYALNSNTTINRAANAPYSNRKTEIELAGDYRLDKRQTLRLAYDYEKVKRWCDDYALAANCLVGTSNTENKLGIKYKLKASDDVSLNAGYSYADRDGKFDHNAITPLSGRGAQSLTLVNAQDFPGFIAYIYAPRKQDLLKAGVNWQASEKLELSAEGRYANDDYHDSTLGLQESRTTGINLDATYSYSDDASVSAYVSWQNSKRDMRIGAAGAGAVNTATSFAALVAPTNIWTNELDEDSNAIGINTKHRLMDGKLELFGDLSYSLDKSQYSTQVPYDPNCSLPTVLSCGDLPDIKSELISLKVNGTYALDKSAKISVGYLYQKLNSDDYSYNWYQLGYTGTRGMPTNQQAPNYSVNVVAVSYVYNF
jgi:MtrB/PioB family decaheme-associated outer membrane protein